MKIRANIRRVLMAGLSVVASFALAGAASATARPQAAFPAKQYPKHGLVIAFDNGVTGNTWNAQAQQDFQQAAVPYEKAGIIKRVIVENADNSLSTQISQIQDLISSGVNAIVLQALSPTALTPVLKEAIAKGIVVIGAAGGVDTPGAVNVQFNQVEWTKKSALWVFQHMHDKGNLLVVNGLAGQSTNTIRWDTVQQLLKHYPHIHLLQQVNCDWVEADAQQAVSSVLSSYPTINGVWTQDGCGVGTIDAFEAAHRAIPVLATDDNVQYLRVWAQLAKKTGFQSIAVANPPGDAADGLLVAVRLLEGWKIKPSAWQPNELDPSEKNAVYVEPTLVVTQANLAKVLKQYASRPNSYYLDFVLSTSQVNSYFVGH
ncbi:MAG: substrate-binding domain-containing protein [Firmicutes bacterium]|nr:substrate-binding domain-containing protein [Bacillota bacterium]